MKIPVAVAALSSVLEHAMHPHAVTARYTFAPSGHLPRKSFLFYITPEFILPKVPAVAGDALERIPRHSPFIFWAVPRSGNSEKCNCEIKNIVVHLSTVVSFVEATAHAGSDPDLTWSYVDVPAIVNTRDIAAGEEIVLKVDLPAPKPKPQKLKTWQTDVAAAAAKKPKKS